MNNQQLSVTEVLSTNAKHTRARPDSAFLFVAAQTLLVSKRRVFRRFMTIILVVIGLGTSNLWAATNAAPAPAPRRNVLIIYSWHDLMPWQAGVRAGLQENLQQASEASRPNIYEERVDAGRIGDTASNAALYNYLREKYGSIQLDIVVAESQNPRMPPIFC